MKSESVRQASPVILVEVQEGDNKRSFTFGKSRLVVGSVESADLRLSAPEVAPIHALIEVSYSNELTLCSVRVVDLASPFGVSVRGARVVNEEVPVGEPVRIGEALIRFQFALPSVEEPLPDQALLLIDRNEVDSIFDYSPATRECLEVVYSFNGSIFEVRHFTDEQAVTLGSEGRVDFPVPPLLKSGKSMKWLERQGDHWALSLDPAMSGVVYKSPKLLPVEDLQKRSPGGTVTISSGDFAKIQLGDLTLFVSRTVSPPAIKKQSPFTPDPFLLRSFLVSLPVSLLMIIGMGAVSLRLEDPIIAEPPPPPAPPPGFVMTYPAELPPPAPVEPVVKSPEPPKKLEVDLTKPLKTVEVKPGKVGKKSSPKRPIQSKPKEGEGAKASGKEGSRGAKKAPVSKKPIDSAYRSSTNTGPGRGGMKSEISDQGNIQMMKSALDSALDAIGGSGIKIGETGDTTKGVGVIDTAGAGGRLVKGTGKGGGGTADKLLGGAGKKGNGAGRSGTGKATDGKAGGIISGGELGPLSKGDPEAVIVGAVDPAAIEQAIRRHSNEFRYCYERELNAGNPKLSGKIFTTFVIGPSGLANQTAIKSSTVKNAMVEKCVLQVIRRITEFPKPAGGASVTVTYPFTYQTPNK
jgi:hypothetical protein